METIKFDINGNAAILGLVQLVSSYSRLAIGLTIGIVIDLAIDLVIPTPINNCTEKCYCYRKLTWPWMALSKRTGMS